MMNMIFTKLTEWRLKRFQAGWESHPARKRFWNENDIEGTKDYTPFYNTLHFHAALTIYKIGLQVYVFLVRVSKNEQLLYQNFRLFVFSHFIIPKIVKVAFTCPALVLATEMT